MEFLRRLLRPHKLTEEERARQGAKLDAKRRHLRGKMSQKSGEIRRAWTEYRTWRGDAAGKKQLRARIRVLEAERKAITKAMLKLQSEMKRLGFQTAAGYVEVSA